MVPLSGQALQARLQEAELRADDLAQRIPQLEEALASANTLVTEGDTAQAGLRAQLDESIMGHLDEDRLMLEIQELERALAEANAHLGVAELQRAELSAALEATKDESTSREAALTTQIEALSASLASTQVQAWKDQSRLDAINQAHNAMQVWQCFRLPRASFFWCAVESQSSALSSTVGVDTHVQVSVPHEGRAPLIGPVNRNIALGASLTLYETL